MKHRPSTYLPLTQQATIVRFNNKVQIQGWAEDSNHVIPKDPNYIYSQAKRWMVRNTFQTQHENIIATHLRHGQTVMAVSDGSYHPELKHCTSAWVIRPDNKATSILGKNLVPGGKEVQCSHRSELSGLIGAVQHINLIYD